MTKNPQIWKVVRNTEDAPITQGFPKKGDIIILTAVDDGEVVKSFEVISDPVIEQTRFLTGQTVVDLVCLVIDKYGRKRPFRWGRKTVLVPA